MYMSQPSSRNAGLPVTWRTPPRGRPTPGRFFTRLRPSPRRAIMVWSPSDSSIERRLPPSEQPARVCDRHSLAHHTDRVPDRHQEAVRIHALPGHLHAGYDHGRAGLEQPSGSSSLRTEGPLTSCSALPVSYCSCSAGWSRRRRRGVCAPPGRGCPEAEGNRARERESDRGRLVP